MGLFNRAITAATGSQLPKATRPGAGLLAFLRRVAIATDANLTLTVDQMSGGLVNFTGFTAGRNVTTPTAALMLTACPDMDIGDSFTVIISVTPAFAATYVAGTGVTLAGRATTPASSFSLVTITKLSATTVEWFVA